MTTSSRPRPREHKGASRGVSSAELEGVRRRADLVSRSRPAAVAEAQPVSADAGAVPVLADAGSTVHRRDCPLIAHREDLHVLTGAEADPAVCRVCRPTLI